MAKPHKKGLHSKTTHKLEAKLPLKAPPKSEPVRPASVPISDSTFTYIILGVFFILGLIGVYHHEMWRDELQIWLVGSSAHNFSEFLRNMTNECNPLGWYGLDFILSRFSDSPFIVQIFHLLLATGSVYMLLKYASFTRMQKVFVCFSYYLFFEYSLVARGYALTIFLIFLFVTLFQQVKLKNRYVIISLVLFCIPNTTGHGVIMTLALLGMMMADYLFSEDITIRKRYKPMQFYIGVGIALLGIYIAMRWITPPPGNHYGNNWYTGVDSHRMELSFRTFWMSFLPIPQFANIHFWNSNYFYTADTSAFTFFVLRIISIAILLFCFIYYSNKISVAIFYFAATIGVILFHYTNNVIFAITAANHYGFLFITFVVAAWLAPNVKKTKLVIPGLKSIRNKLKIEKTFAFMVTGLFAINMLGGLIAYGKDYANIFSNITRTGEYIVDHHLDKLPETGFIDYAVSPISAWTKQPIYFPDRDTTGRFTISIQTHYSFDPQLLYNRMANFISKQKDSVLYISTGDYYGIGEGKTIGNIQFTKLASFYDCIREDENYILYIAKNFNLDKEMQNPNSFKNPAEVNSILVAANNLMQNGKLDEAEKILNTVKEKTNGAAIPHLYNYFGILYTKKNMTKDAEQEFNTEIRLNLVKEESYFNLGLLYFQNKDYDKAITSFDSTVSIGPRNADAYSYLGVCYANFKKDYVKGMAYFEKVVELNPNFTQGYFNVLVCAQNSNNEDAVIKYTRILLDKGTTIQDLKSKGINYSDDLLKKINSR